MTIKSIHIKKKLAVTLMELIVTLIIIGIVLGMAFINYRRQMEKNKATNAEVNLIVIYQAEKRYKLDNPNGLYCVAPTCSANTTAEINQALGLDIIDPYFEYKVENDGSGGFRAIATRKDGACSGATMNVTNSNSTADTGGCSLW